MDDLPNNFDVIVIGTGMPECIIAAAAARVGKTVLHMDRNGYYGGEWTSFNFDYLLNWIQENKDDLSQEQDELPSVQENWQELLLEGERMVLAPKYSKTISNVTEFLFIREEPVQTEDEVTETFNVEAQDNTTCEVEQVQAVASVSSHCTYPESHDNVGHCSGDAQPCTSNSVLKSNDEFSSDSSVPTNEGVADSESHEEQDTDSNTPLVQTCSNQNHEESVQESANCTEASGVNATCPASSVNRTNVSREEERREWTLSDLKGQHRKFNLDLAPKLLFSRGPLVELLISSNIARYAEFKCFTRVLTLIDGCLQQVPCSRADVFSTKNVSVVEKRMLMKLLTFCLEYQKHPDEYRGFEGAPFVEFLKSKKLTSSVEHYILHAIAMVDESTPTLQGLQATQKFLESLGRYGNSPFLWTLYGSAELPQCFCRLCAVFGGIYYLKRAAEALIIDAEGTCTGIISQGSRLSCRWLVMESSYSPREYLPEETSRLSRAIFITDSSILPTEREQLTLLRLPPKDGIKSAVTVLELGPAAYVCPSKLYVVHMICSSVAESAKDDLIPAAQRLFQPSVEWSGVEQQENSPNGSPKVLWCVFFNQKDTTGQHLNDRAPPGVVLVSSPGVEQDYEFTVNEAREMFQKMYPGEEFLPRAPDPEDIVLEEEANPGEPVGFSDKTANKEESVVSEKENEEDKVLNDKEVVEATKENEDKDENDITGSGRGDVEEINPVADKEH